MTINTPPRVPVPLNVLTFLGVYTHVPSQRSTGRTAQILSTMSTRSVHFNFSNKPPKILLKYTKKASMTMYSKYISKNKKNVGQHLTEANRSVKTAYRSALAIRYIKKSQYNVF